MELDLFSIGIKLFENEILLDKLFFPPIFQYVCKSMMWRLDGVLVLPAAGAGGVLAPGLRPAAAPHQLGRTDRRGAAGWGRRQVDAIFPANLQIFSTVQAPHVRVGDDEQLQPGALAQQQQGGPRHLRPGARWG